MTIIWCRLLKNCGERGGWLTIGIAPLVATTCLPPQSPPTQPKWLQWPFNKIHTSVGICLWADWNDSTISNFFPFHLVPCKLSWSPPGPNTLCSRDDPLCGLYIPCMIAVKRSVFKTRCYKDSQCLQLTYEIKNRCWKPFSLPTFPQLN